jgi:hypothetical protein
MLSKNYAGLEKLDTSNLCLNVKFLPKDQYIDQKPVETRQFQLAMSAEDFSKHFEGKDCTVEEAFKFAGYSEKEIAEQKKEGKKAVGIVWQGEVKLDDSIRATWDRVFNAVLPTAAKNMHELLSEKATASIWSQSSEKNSAFVSEVSAIRLNVEKLDAAAWSDQQLTTVETFLQSKSAEEKPKLARQALNNLFLLGRGFKGEGSTLGGANQYLVQTPYNDKLKRFFKYGELEPKHGYFSIRWADQIESGKNKK